MDSAPTSPEDPPVEAASDRAEAAEAGSDSEGPGPEGALERWYEDGLAFGCTACGRCCRDHGEYSYVYVSERDLEALAVHLDLTEQAFRDAYCAEDDGWTILKRRGDACVLLDDQGLCSAYEARPKQCATWPYWVDNIRSPKVWEVDVKGVCPGIGKGEVTSADEIDRIAWETEDWYEAD